MTKYPPKANWLKTETPKARSKRLAVHAHNACFGHVRFMLVHAQQMAVKPTLTPEAQATAMQISLLVTLLQEQLLTRVDET